MKRLRTKKPPGASPKELRPELDVLKPKVPVKVKVEERLRAVRSQRGSFRSSELMENLLRAKGLWSLVEEGYTEPAEGIEVTTTQKRNLEELKMKDQQVKHYRFQAIDRVVFEQILNRKTSKIIWDSMKKKFGGNKRVKWSLLQTLRRDFEILEMKNEENIDDYFGRVMAVSNKMRSNKEDMLDSKIVEKILRTLTDKFTYVVVSIEESKDIGKMMIDELQSSLSVHEEKFKKISHEECDQALNVEAVSLSEAEDHTEVEAGAEDAHSRKQQSSVTTATNVDISNMNVQMGTMENKLKL
ncbi:uncharacterized protein LOC111462003 [Cucurbita moschata]|uniref:Uncharacterized protein LOC111462003 n=1 Tax=Cucurbita moschata TaxID=3662 RepID=A0A6J1HA60_CUCMO|nr:uncharacterized protein LOC111462003 [Cucurbita moschata]